MVSFKNFVKGLFCIDGRFNSKFYDHFASGQKSLIEISSFFSQVDTIRDPEPLKQFRKSVDNHNAVWYSTDPNLSNSLIYGIWSSMFGSFGDKPLYETPAVEHGLIFHNSIFTDLRYTCRPVAVTFGQYRKRVIRQFTDKAIFQVGPYIRYAAPYYTLEEYKTLKNELGKVLLLFPAHGTNEAIIQHEHAQYLAKVDALAEDYDTVLVNAFWWNINDPIIDAFERMGYRVVSAGFRDDVRFLSRLRTLIDLADLVAGDEIGTHVGYSLALGTPYRSLSVSKHVCERPKEKLDLTGGDIKNALWHLFDGSSEINCQQIEECEPYWGFSQSKTREELKLIFEMSSAIAREAKYREKRYGSAAFNLAESYPKGSHERRLLNEALQ